MTGLPASLLLAISTLAVLSFTTLALLFKFGMRSSKLSIPRIGQTPGILGNTSRGHFFNNSLQLLQEGYARYKDSLYLIWTTDMDRVIVSRDFMKDFSSLSRKQLRLTASVRHAGPYTGFDIAEESELQFIVCAGQLSQNIGRLAQPAFDEICSALMAKLEKPPSTDGTHSLLPFPLAIELITHATSRVFVGSELCRDPEWLATATGYTMDVAKVTADLNKHYRFLHPVIAPFLPSYHQIRKRFLTARRLLKPLITERRAAMKDQYLDMVQWLVHSAKGRDAELDKLVTRMLFLNAAAIHTTAETATNVLLDLCARPEDMAILRNEMLYALREHDGINLTTLSSLKKTDSFMKESHRLNSLGLMTFNRQLAVPLTLSNNVTLPKNTYISMTHFLINRDADLYPDPMKFDPLRFLDMRKAPGQEEQHQFASLSSQNPAWGVGKFACPGRFWASAQIKLMLMAILLDYEIGYPDGQIERPLNEVKGEKNQIKMTQNIVLKKRNGISM